MWNGDRRGLCSGECLSPDLKPQVYSLTSVVLVLPMSWLPGVQETAQTEGMVPRLHLFLSL